jgi:large subunit ribosomal protein L1
MGKTKMAVMDDSVAEEPKAKKEPQVTKPAEEIKAKENAAKSSAKELSEAVSKEDQKAAKKAKKSKASQKKGVAKYRSVKYKAASEKVEKSKKYALPAAIELAKETSYSKFDGSLELHLKTNAKNIRGLVSLPFASGKKLKILAFGKGAADSGADIVGDDAKLNEIIRGITSSFDVIVTTAEWMPKLARAAKILGPRGLMPSPKNGTITENLKKAVEEIQSGKVEYKTEKNGSVIHLTVGKTSQLSEEIAQNTKILFNTIGKTKIKKAVISPSMGLGIKVDLATI